MEETNKRDLTTGPIGSKLLQFSLPIMVVMLLQSVYNIVDMVIVGQILGPTGMSAVGIGGQVTALLLAISNGFSNGNAVVVGQLFGGKKTEDIRKVVGSLLSFSILLALLFSAAILLLRTPLLDLLLTPAESYQQTASYLTVCVIGTIFVYVYNVFVSALRGIGESFMPMVFVGITTVENLLLDIWFVGYTPLGVTGAALATIISQLTSMLLIIVYTCRKTELFSPKLASLRVDAAKLKATLRVGLPQAAQFTLTSTSFLLLLSIVNSYGVESSAVAAAVAKIAAFGIIPGQAFMSGLITMTAQNMPHNNYKRISAGLRFAALITALMSVLIFLICLIWPSAVYSLFTSDTVVVELGITYLQLYAISFLLDNVMFCFFGVLTGSGHTAVTFVCAIFSAYVARYGLAVLLSGYTSLAFNGIALAYSGAPLVGIVVAGAYFFSGRWKTKKLSL